MIDGTIPVTRSEILRLLVHAEFMPIAHRFRSAGLAVSVPAEGIMQIAPTLDLPTQAAVLISVGVHGDETAPIEMLAQLVDHLIADPHELKVNLMLVVGNPAAIAQGKRCIDVDMNRQFYSAQGDPGEMKNAVNKSTLEARRADIIMRSTAEFFSAACAEKWHLDLHTAIRASLYPTFAVVPDLIAPSAKRALIGWLADAGLDAVVMNSTAASTYSSYSAKYCGAASSTLELGRIGVIGQNDLRLLAQPQAALLRLIHAEPLPDLGSRQAPPVFNVAQEMIKRSDAFTMAFDHSIPNFTAMQYGTVIAIDGALVYRVRHAEEWVLFPNPDVALGQRAGLMLVRQ